MEGRKHGRDYAQLQEKRNAAAAKIKELADRQDSWTAEDREAWDSVNSDYDSIGREIDDQKAKDEIAARAAAVAEAQERSVNDRIPGLVDGSGRQSPEAPKVTDEDRNAALRAWMRHANDMDVSDADAESAKRVGVNFRKKEFVARGRPSDSVRGNGIWARSGRPMLEKRAMSVGTAADGGYTVPEGFSNELERQLLAFGGPRQVCRTITTESGNDIPWPTVNDTGNSGALLAENTTIGSSVDPTFGVVTLKSYKYSSTPIMVSQELIEDSGFNLGEVIASLLGERIGRITATHFTTGDNSSKPQGISVAAGTGVTAASATAITGDEIIDLVHSLDPAYRGMDSTGFMLADATLKAVRQLKDSNGLYLWQPSVQAGVPDLLFGYPVSINQDMPAMTTGNDSVLFGAMEKYIIRDVGMIRLHRLEERYRDLDQTGFIAFMRSDGRALQSAALKVLTQA